MNLQPIKHDKFKRGASTAPGFPVEDKCPHCDEPNSLHYRNATKDEPAHWYCDSCGETHDDTLPVMLFAPRPTRKPKPVETVDPILTPKPFVAKLRQLGGMS